MRGRFWLRLSLALWAVQGLLALGVGVAALAAPDWLLRYADLAAGSNAQVSARLTGSLLIAVGLVVLWALTLTARWLYRGLAKMLAIPIIGALVLLWPGAAGIGWREIAVGAAAVVLLLVYAVGGKARSIAERSDGAKPSANFVALSASTLWRLQALWWLLLGVAFLVAPGEAVESCLSADGGPVPPLVLEVAGLTALMHGIVSLVATGPQRGPSFRHFCRLFTLNHLLILVTVLVDYLPEHNTLCMSFIAVPAAFFFFMNVAFGLNPKWADWGVEWLRHHLRWAWSLQLALFVGGGLTWLLASGNVIMALAKDPGQQHHSTPSVCKSKSPKVADASCGGLLGLWGSDSVLRTLAGTLLAQNPTTDCASKSTTVEDGSRRDPSWLPASDSALMALAKDLVAQSATTDCVSESTTVADGSDLDEIWLPARDSALMALALDLAAGRGTATSASESDDATETYAVGVFAVRAIGPVALCMAALTLMGMLREDQRLRRQLQRALLVWFVAWNAVFLYNVTGHFYAGESRATVLSVGLAIPSFALMLFNMLLAMVPLQSEVLGYYRGAADTKPRYLYVSWLAQGAIFFAFGLTLLLWPEDVAYLILKKPEVVVKVVESDQIRMTAPYWMSLGAVSAVAARATRPWVWRQFARIFIFGLTLWIWTFVHGYDPSEFEAGVTGMVALMGGLVALNVLALRTPQVLRNAGQLGPARGLIIPDYFSAGLMAIQTFLRRRRASHLFGVAARGTIQLNVHSGGAASFPHNAFFRRFRGKSLMVEGRFANLTHEDDAALDVRGAALKLYDAEEGGEAVFDMVMNTGSFSPPRNVREFARFVLSKWLPRWVVRAVLLRDLVSREGGVGGLRRAPTSYGDLIYYSQIARLWIGSYGSPRDPQLTVDPPEPAPLPGAQPTGLPKIVVETARARARQDVTARQGVFLARYRLIPEKLVSVDEAGHRLYLYDQQTGLPDEHDAAALWRRERRPDAGMRPKNYLRMEFVERLRQRKPVRFVFQAQFEPIDEPGLARGEQLAWYNAGVDWPESRPWHDLGTVDLDTIMTEKETEQLRFNPNLHPRSMGIPEAAGTTDYRSLGDSEARVMRTLGKLRAALYGVLGLPRAGISNQRSQLDPAVARAGRVGSEEKEGTP